MAATVFIAASLHFRSKGDGEVFVDDTLSYHLANLVRQRDLLSSIWLWYILPLAPGFVLLRIGTHMTLAPGQQPVHLAYDGVAVALGVGLAWFNRKAAHALDREIEAIRDLRQASH